MHLSYKYFTSESGRLNLVQKPEVFWVNHSMHFHKAHLNVSAGKFNGVAGHLHYVQTPLGQREREHSFKALQYVQLYIPPGWRLVKIQWEISGKECYGFMHVRYHLSKNREDIQAEIYNEEARACKWGSHVCGLWLFFSPLSHLFSILLCHCLCLLRSLEVRCFYEPYDSPSSPSDLFTMFHFSHLCLKLLNPLYLILFDRMCYYCCYLMLSFYFYYCLLTWLMSSANVQ